MVVYLPLDVKQPQVDEMVSSLLMHRHSVCQDGESDDNRLAQKEATMNALTTIGLDVAKHTFQVVGCDERGHEVRRKGLRRGQVRLLCRT